MFHKTKNNSVKVIYSVLTAKMCRQNINKLLGVLMVKSKTRKGIIPVPFRIYVNFECKFRGVESYKRSYTKKYQDHVLCSFAYKVVCVDIRFIKRIVVYRGENGAYEFIKAILKEYKYCTKVMNKLFNKNVIMS